MICTWLPCMPDAFMTPQTWSTWKHSDGHVSARSRCLLLSNWTIKWLRKCYDCILYFVPIDRAHDVSSLCVSFKCYYSFMVNRILCHFALLQDLFKSVARAISHHVMETTKGLPTSGNCMWFHFLFIPVRCRAVLSSRHSSAPNLQLAPLCGVVCCISSVVLASYDVVAYSFELNTSFYDVGACFVSYIHCFPWCPGFFCFELYTAFHDVAAFLFWVIPFFQWWSGLLFWLIVIHYTAFSDAWLTLLNQHTRELISIWKTNTTTKTWVANCKSHLALLSYTCFPFPRALFILVAQCF